MLFDTESHTHTHKKRILDLFFLHMLIQINIKLYGIKDNIIV